VLTGIRSDLLESEAGAYEGGLANATQRIAIVITNQAPMFEGLRRPSGSALLADQLVGLARLAEAKGVPFRFYYMLMGSDKATTAFELTQFMEEYVNSCINLDSSSFRVLHAEAIADAERQLRTALFVDSRGGYIAE